MSRMGNKEKNPVVLVGVLKNRRDLNILLNERWYRMPVAKAPKRKFDYVALYQPASFGKDGKKIQYYGKVAAIKTQLRSVLLPDEIQHQNAHEPYFKVSVSEICQLRHPIKNLPPRRINFALVPWGNFMTAKNILELYHVPPTEQLIERALQKLNISTISQYRITAGQKRYILDLAIVCRRGSVAIECDNKKAHAGKIQKKRDREKDRFLRRRGWRVIRLNEQEIIFNIRGCLFAIEKAMRRLGGAK